MQRSAGAGPAAALAGSHAGGGDDHEGEREGGLGDPRVGGVPADAAVQALVAGRRGVVGIGGTIDVRGAEEGDEGEAEHAQRGYSSAITQSTR